MTFTTREKGDYKIRDPYSTVDSDARHKSIKLQFPSKIRIRAKRKHNFSIWVLRSKYFSSNTFCELTRHSNEKSKLFVKKGSSSWQVIMTKDSSGSEQEERPYGWFQFSRYKSNFRLEVENYHFSLFQ